MRFAVLGPLQVVRGDGENVAVAGSKQRELLAILLLHRNRPLSPAQLVSHLWGDDAPSAAEVTLRSHVSHLRRRLTPASDGVELTTGPAGYTLTVSTERLDATRFEELVGLGQEALGLGHPHRAAELVREALALWRGRPWAELDHVDVAVADTARLEELRQVAHEVLGTAELEAGRHREVVGELEALVTEHPYRERFTSLLLVALYRSGRQADALDAYHRTRARLADDLGLDPGVELQELVQAVLRQDPALMGDAPSAVVSAAAPPGPHEPVDAVLAASARAPLVGRGRELAGLRAAWETVVGGGTSLVLVSGESGIGKTRLVAELFGAEPAEGHSVLVGRCADPGMPYSPFTDALGEQLEPLLGGADRRALHAGVRRLVAGLAARGPLMIVVEDAERIDHASAQLLRNLVPALPPRTGIVLCYRDPPGGRHPPLLELVGDPTIATIADRVALGPIEESAALDLLTELAPEAPPELAARLWRHAGGNPYFTTELARALARRSAADAEATQLPTTIRDVLRQRLSALSDAAQEVLPVAAVLGTEVDFELLARLVDADEDVLIAALEEAVLAGFLVESGQSWGASYAFPHELMRDATRRTLRPPQLNRLHLRVARALEATMPDGAPGSAAVARHLREAGSAADPAEAADWSLRAARDAQAVYAWDEAIEHAEQAISLLQAGADPARTAEVAVEVATLRLRAGRGFDRAVALLEMSLETALDHDGGPDEAWAGRLHARLGGALSTHHTVMDIPRALDHFEAAGRLLGPAEDSYVFHSSRAQAAMYGVRTDLLDAAVSAAQRISSASGRRDHAVIAGWARAWVAFNAGRLRDCDEVSEEAWRSAHQAADPYLVWVAVQAPALRASAYLLDPATARMWCRRALGQPRITTLVHSHDTMVDQLALALALQGDLVGAEQAAAGLPATSVAGRLLLLLGGSWEEAEETFAASIARDEAAGDRHDAALHLRWLAWAQRMQGRPEDAVDALGRAVEIGASGPQVATELAARADLARLTAHHDLSVGRRHLARCAELTASGEDWRGLSGSVELARAVVAGASGNGAASDRHLAKAVEVFETFGLPWHAADAREVGADLARKRT